MISSRPGSSLHTCHDANLTGFARPATIDMMTFHQLKRVVAPLVIGGLVFLAWSACASDGMAMAEMACCADHAECEMSHVGERCCGPDQLTGLSFLKPSSSDTDLAFSAAERIAASFLLVRHVVIAVSAPTVPVGGSMTSFLDQCRRTTVLRI